MICSATARDSFLPRKKPPRNENEAWSTHEPSLESTRFYSYPCGFFRLAIANSVYATGSNKSGRIDDWRRRQGNRITFGFWRWSGIASATPRCTTTTAVATTWVDAAGRFATAVATASAASEDLVQEAKAKLWSAAVARIATARRRGVATAGRSCVTTARRRNVTTAACFTTATGVAALEQWANLRHVDNNQRLLAAAVARIACGVATA